MCYHSYVITFIAVTYGYFHTTGFVACGCIKISICGWVSAIWSTCTIYCLLIENCYLDVVVNFGGKVEIKPIHTQLIFVFLREGKVLFYEVKYILPEQEKAN